jgi:tRNA U34 5-carboxymethylaminomethyl modifying GTPase MnmE/TrmE
MEELTPEQNYRFALIEAVNQLIEARNDLQVKIVNLAMSGEFSEINDIFEVGDEIPVDLEYFKNIKDINVNALLKMYYDIDHLVNHLCNINNIDEEELDVEVE